MNKSFFLAAAIGLSAPALLWAATPTSTPAPPPAPPMAPVSAANAAETAMYEKKMDALTAQYEALRIATEDNPNFRRDWLNRLRLYSAVKPKTAQTPNFVLSISGEILLDGINPYLRRSDDESAIAFMNILTQILSVGASDEQTCKTFLSSTNKTEVSDSDNAKLEATLGPKFYDQMMVTTGRVMRAGNTGPERVLDEAETQRVTIEMLNIMMAKYGKESAVGLANFNNKNVPDIQKCRTMVQMMGAIGELDSKSQGALIRTIFGADNGK